MHDDSTPLAHDVMKRVRIVQTRSASERHEQLECSCGWRSETIDPCDASSHAAAFSAATRHGKQVGADVFAESQRRSTQIIALILRWRRKRDASEPGETAAMPPVAPPTPAAKPPRTRRPSPSRLAKWEAHWQADAEAES